MNYRSLMEERVNYSYLMTGSVVVAFVFAGVIQKSLDGVPLGFPIPG